MERPGISGTDYGARPFTFTQGIQLNKVLVLCFGLAATSALAEDLDNRRLLTLTESQRRHVLEEMRILLSGTQAILAALAKDDMTAVAQYARRLGMGMADKAEDHLKGALPKEFMQLGMSVHQDFDQIATDAESLKDSKHTLWQLSESMNKCAVCHASYQIHMINQPPKRAGKIKRHGH